MADNMFELKFDFQKSKLMEFNFLMLYVCDCIWILWVQEQGCELFSRGVREVRFEKHPQNGYSSD